MTFKISNLHINKYNLLQADLYNLDYNCEVVNVIVFMDNKWMIRTIGGIYEKVDHEILNDLNKAKDEFYGIRQGSLF